MTFKLNLLLALSASRQIAAPLENKIPSKFLIVYYKLSLFVSIDGNRIRKRININCIYSLNFNNSNYMLY